jgi:hypothetical protein
VEEDGTSRIYRWAKQRCTFSTTGSDSHDSEKHECGRRLQNQELWFRNFSSELSISLLLQKNDNHSSQELDIMSVDEDFEKSCPIVFIQAASLRCPSMS